MKDSIYTFISEYVYYYEESKKYKIVVPKIVAFPENSEVKRILNLLKDGDSDVYNTILKLDQDDILYEYLKFLIKYYDKKKLLRMRSSQIAQITKIPMLSIRKFENLQHIPSLKMMLVIAKSVNLTLKWE